MITDDDVVFLMQRGAVVALGIESEEESAKHMREQIEAIVARELAEKTALVERLREIVEAKAYRTIIRCKPAYVVNYDDVIEALSDTEQEGDH